MSEHAKDCKAVVDPECGPCTCDLPTPRALTREQVENSLAKIAEVYAWKHVINYLREHDESQRLTIARLEREIEQARGNYAIQQAAADMYERERDEAETERIEWVTRAERAEQRAEELQARVTELEETVRKDGRV